MNSKKLWAAIGGAALLASIAIPALAATDASVTATVTPGTISVTVSPGAIGYGTVGVPTVDRVPQTPGVDQVITANNDGGIPETFNIKGADATGTTIIWHITTGVPSGASGVPTYGYNHKFNRCTDDLLACTTTAGLNTMDINYEELAANVHPTTSDSRYFKLALSTPTTTGGDTSVHSTTVTVQAVAF